jgi:hypothetical protein
MRVLILLSLAVIYVSAGAGKFMGGLQGGYQGGLVSGLAAADAGAGAYGAASPEQLQAADTALSQSMSPLWSMQYTASPSPIASPAISQVAASLPAVTTTSVPLSLASKSRPFTSVNAPINADSNTLPVIELSPITQTYNVPQTLVSQENIKQPINQPIYQPYLQRYIQQAQPVIQPVINRVVQPVVHRQLKPFLTSQTVQGPAASPITNPAQYQTFSNQPIMGTELPSAPMLSSYQSYQAAPLSSK